MLPFSSYLILFNPFLTISHFLRLPIHVLDFSGLPYIASTISYRLQTRLQTPDVSLSSCVIHSLAFASLYCLGHAHICSSRPFRTVSHLILAHSRFCLSFPLMLFSPFCIII